MANNSVAIKILLIILIITGFTPDAQKSLLNESPDPPKAVYKLGNTQGSLTRLPDGTLMLFKMEGMNLISVISDDGHTWNTPVVIARITKKGTQLSYPYIFEVKPGELWITTYFAGNLRIRLLEKDFI